MSSITEFDIRGQITGSIRDLFDSMLSMEILPDETTDHGVLGNSRIASSVSFAGEVRGSVNLNASMEFGAEMAAAMLGMEPDEIEEGEIKDVLLEMSNIIGGNLKSSFNDSGMHCYLGTPSITVGENFRIETLNMVRYEHMCFVAGTNHLFVEVWVKAAEDASPDVLRRLTSIDIRKFGTLDIISMTGDKMIELFDTMLSMRLELSDPAEAPSPEDVQIVASVSLAGDARGNVHIQVGEDFGRLITGRMTNKPLEEVGDIDEIKDAVGEVANILGGSLKSAFCDAGLECEISPPNITAGHNFKIEILNMARYERFAFQFYDYRIAVEVCVKIDEGAKVEAAPAPPPFDAAEMLKAKDGEAGLGGKAADMAAAGGTVSTGKTETEDVSSESEKAETSDVVSSTDRTVTEDRPPAVHKARESDKPSAPPKAQKKGPEPPSNISFLLDVPLEITVELGRTKLPIDKVLGLGPGSIVELKELDGEPVTILANKNVIAHGELVVVQEKYGVRIKEIISRIERIKGLNKR